MKRLCERWKGKKHWSIPRTNEVQVTGRVVVREVSAELGNSGFVVKTWLRVKLDISVVMQEDDLERKQSKSSLLNFQHHWNYQTRKTLISPPAYSLYANTQTYVHTLSFSRLQKCVKFAWCLNVNQSILEMTATWQTSLGQYQLSEPQMETGKRQLLQVP